MTEAAAERYHRLTSYVADREWDVPADDPALRHDLQPNDPATLPPPVKRYPPGRPAVALTRDLPPTAPAATAVLAGQLPGAPDPLDAAHLGRVLFLCAGVVRTGTSPTGVRHLFRAAGSAGARFPVELYAVTVGVVGVPDGVYWYDPEAHVLVQVGPPATAGTTTVVLTGVPWRTGWRYAERGYRHIGWDTGTVLAQLVAAATSSGWPARVWTRFPDADVRRLVGAVLPDELPMALVTVGDGRPAVVPSGPAVPGVVDERVQEFPLVTAAHLAGDGQDTGPPWPAGDRVTLAPPAGATGAPVEEVVLRRGSTRRMNPSVSVPRAVLDWAVAVATRGIDQPQVVAVHAVDGYDPGLYRWTQGSLVPTGRGTSREEMYRVCLDQSLARDAAFVVVSCADLGGVGARGYREAQMAGGIVEGRLHLAAYACGLGASGMTFIDAEMPALLGPSLDAVVMTCVGAPDYTSRPGGGPGAPVEIRRVSPR